MGSLRRHRRFLAAFALGLALVAGLRLAEWRDLPLSSLVGFDSFALCYLVLVISHFRALSPSRLRLRSQDEDEGIVLIGLLASVAVAVSLGAILGVLQGEAADWTARTLALLAAPLGWAMVQCLAAVHYAHLHYLPGAGDPVRFPGKGVDPGPWDFLYLAFTIGMTAQVSDASLGTTRLRRAVLVHSVLSFFYNTVILALAVNASLTLI